MKNPISSLATAYYNILDGNLTLPNYGMLPVYDGMAPDSEIGSYVLISTDRQAVQVADKCTFYWEAYILVDIVDKSGNFGFNGSDAVSEQIGSLISTHLNPNLAPDFQCITTIANFQNLQGLNPTEPVFRTLVRYFHKIVQL